MPIGRIQLKHGLEASADFNSMLQAEAYYATDTERLMISNGDGTGLLLPSKPELDTIQDDVDTLANNLNLVQSDLMPVSGSNANGSYTKFPDGTLMCWKSFTMTTASHTFAWTFPHEFNPDWSTRRTSNKSIAGSIKISQVFDGSGETVATNANITRQIFSCISNTNATILCTVDALGAGREIDLMVFAVGRWKA